MSVKVHQLNKRYGSFPAVRDVTFEVPSGGIFGFVGPNGAGKTTTLRILAGLLAPTSGEAWVGGESVIQRPRAVRQKVGYMPDFFGVYGDLTVVEYLDFYAHSHGVARSHRQRVIDDLMELVDLVDKRQAFVNTLSRGMKQRLGLARCLVHDPEVLLLDEPASGLDPRARVEMREILRELQKMGKTILVSSHILPELADLCTHLGIVNHGQMLVHGPVADVLAQAQVGQSVVIRVLERAEAVADHLRQRPGVSRVEVGSEGVVADLTGDDGDVAALLRSLVEAGLPVVEFRKRSRGLEELFLEVTGEQEGA